jgi:hypothetical protein
VSKIGISGQSEYNTTYNQNDRAPVEEYYLIKIYVQCNTIMTDSQIWVVEHDQNIQTPNTISLYFF